MAQGDSMIIYALIDPRDNSVRYVGKTHRTAHRRLRRHLAECYLKADTYKDRWIRSLLKENLEPEIIVLQTCASAELLNEAERGHIARLRAEGARLTNLTPGGDGLGAKHTEESKDKIRRALTGKPKSEQHRLHSALAQRGRKASDATRAKLSAARRGRHPEPRYGADNNKTKLTAEEVHEIRAALGCVSQRELGRRYGVSHTAIRYVQIGRNWSREDLRVREFPVRREGTT